MIERQLQILADFPSFHSLKKHLLYSLIKTVMRTIPLIISAVATIALIIVLDVQLPAGKTKTPRLGFFLSPSKGFWQNAEPANAMMNADIKANGLRGNTEVYLDERLVPHVFANNESDAFFAEGYLHAKFRLWQMEFQTYAAAGRLSEIMGDSSAGTNFLKVDQYFRRIGMVYAAENSLAVMEADTLTKKAMDAYTAGVNSYITNLTENDYPIEYKILNYKPEPWTNLKTALFLKYMAYDLTGYEQDFEMTNAKNYFTRKQFDKLFPYEQDSLDPIIPKGSVFVKPAFTVKAPAGADSDYFNFKKDTLNRPDKKLLPDKNNGSNNWAVAGSKTQSGRPILCNDPHLGLRLPSLWFEIQLSTPGGNVYGVSLPGAPAVIIGFNDNCAWGVTNASRDVKDYYEVKFKDSSMNEYWYNGTWQPVTFRKEIIKIKGKPDHVENIAMTVWGPVMYDSHYGDKLHDGKAYAMHWTAHAGSNDAKTFLQLDKAKNFTDYVTATNSYECPGQNFVFATKQGDIAIRQQGSFPAKWRRQGDFVMEGSDDRYKWAGIVPDSENVVMRNPARGFVSSANQYAYDTSYPYYIGGNLEMYRGFLINRELRNMNAITTDSMKRLQTNNYNVFAEMARPVLLKYIKQAKLTEDEQSYFNLFANWNLRNDAGEAGPIIFTTWWDSLEVCMYGDEFAQSKLPMPTLNESTMLEALLKDTAYEFADDITTPQKETVADEVVKAFCKAMPLWKEAQKRNQFTWGTFRKGGFYHLLKIPAFSRTDVVAGGGNHIINAYMTERAHGPSWRMIVELTDTINAYGVYPGGQSGNPGSAYYDNAANTWIAGKYYKLQLMKKDDFSGRKFKGKITFHNS